MLPCGKPSRPGRGPIPARTIAIRTASSSDFGGGPRRGRGGRRPAAGEGGAPVPEPSPFWASAVHADRRPLLLARGRIATGVRAFFGALDFLEVETAILQVSPGNEAHLHAFA